MPHGWDAVPACGLDGIAGDPTGPDDELWGLAAALGVPQAVRAVGRANGANPISVVVPCDRVLGADGSLTGYGGGLERKRWLLMHEGATFADRGGGSR